jgi:hypothetical protein
MITILRQADGARPQAAMSVSPIETLRLVTSRFKAGSRDREAPLARLADRQTGTGLPQ